MAKNGPLPMHPNGDKPITDAMKEYEADCALVEQQRRARQGLQVDYTKAPWLVKEED